MGKVQLQATMLDHHTATEDPRGRDQSDAAADECSAQTPSTGKWEAMALTGKASVCVHSFQKEWTPIPMCHFKGNPSRDLRMADA